MSGNYNNGLLWRGSYEGLFSLHYSITIPAFPIHFTSTGGIGPIVIPDTTILPALHLGVTGDADYSFAVPDIPIPAIRIGFDGAANVGFTAPATTLLSTFSAGTIGLSPIVVGPIFVPAVTNVSFVLPLVGQQSGRISPFSLGNINIDGMSIPLDLITEPIALDAISFSESIPIEIPIEIPASTIDGISMSEVLPIDLSVDIPAVMIPGTTIDPIPLDFDIFTSAGPIDISIIDIPATPGFGNSTTLPSSGFFNTGGGGGSGFGNFGSASSGWFHQAAGELLGGLSGIGNSGSLASGLLNVGTDISGLFNVSTLDLTAPAVISGFGNLGQSLSGVNIMGLIRELTSGGSGGGGGGPSPIEVFFAELQNLDIRNLLNLGNVGGVNLGFANVGDFNLGAGNVGTVNLGVGNLGAQNLGLGNLGDGNVGFSNIGHSNLGFGNSGLAVGLAGIGNAGFGNAGSSNVGLANMGVGNIGLANTGTGNIGIGLVGDNLTGIGGLNSGSGNLGLFNSGTGNIGFFNSGAGNFGIGNSGSYNTGIGNSGTASTGLFNAGSFNTGVANPGGYNTGSFNVGSFNTGDFNPGNTNTGWFNAGDTNTGLFNTGNVNTGAFNSGSLNNGALWTGDHHGLVSFSFNIDITGSTLLDLNETFNLGPVHIDQIDIPGMSLFDIHEIIDIGPFMIEPIDVPAVTLDIHESINIDPIVLLPATTIPFQTITIPIDGPASPAPPPFELPLLTVFLKNVFGGEDTWIVGSTDSTGMSGGNVTPPTEGIRINFAPGSATTGSFEINLGPIEIPEIATSSIPLNIDVSGDVLPAFTLFPGGLSIPENAIPLTIDASGVLDPITLFPGGYTIDPLPLNIALNLSVPDTSIPLINIPPTPGFGNTTSVPSSGFFNSGAGGVSGFGNFGAGSSGWWNQASSAVLGSGSGFLNAGSLSSGVLNLGSGMSGIYNTSTLGVGVSAVVSGLGNLGHQLSGLSVAGTTLQQSLILDLGLANVGNFNVGFGNVGDVNWGAANLGDLNVGLGNIGGGNDTGHSNTGIANSGNVNTGAFISGSDSNGILWRGNYQGLAGFSLGYTIPLFPAVGADVTGGIGPITVLPPIHIPSIPWGITALGDIGPIAIPDIPIPTIHLGIDPTVEIGTITVAPITVNAPGFSSSFAVSIPMTSNATPGWVFRPSFSPIAFTIDPGGAGSSILLGTIVGPTVDSASSTIPGFTIPTEPIGVNLPLSLTIPGFTIPGGTLIPQLPVDLGLSGGTPPFDTPTIVIDRIALDLHAATTIGPINIPIAGFGGTPGFGNSTTVPSSGFFNAGGGGGSGIHNFGTGMSGLLNAMSDPMLGAVSGFANFGTQLSGILNRGADISGLYNRSVLDLVTSAVISGFGNIGQNLSGLLFIGTGP